MKSKQCSSYMFLESDDDRNVLSNEQKTSTPIKSSAIGPEPYKNSFTVPIEKESSTPELEKKYKRGSYKK